MRKKTLKRLFSAFLALTLTAQVWTANAFDVKADVVSGAQAANFDFESDLTGWTTTGTVTVESGGVSGSKYVKLAASSSITMTVDGLAQGSYTLSGWFRGTKGNNTSKITVSETGGPDSVALLDAYLDSATWTQVGHRNVLVYNGQMKITISSGTGASIIELDDLALALDSEDSNTVSNWDMEDGLNSWTDTGAVSVDTQNADTGTSAVKLGADGEISQVVAVEPNTRYALTMRAKVDVQDTFKTIIHTNYRGKTGETQERTLLGDRVNLGVRAIDGTVIRQAPSGTADYSLISITFTTGADDHEVEIYANTKYDVNYTDSVTIYKTEGTELADEWAGNGDDNAYVDNFDLFEIEDENYLRGADVSFLPLIEDNDGKYFANGVQQDCLRILSNHGVNSITNMIMVKAGSTLYDPSTLKAMYHDWWTTADGGTSLMKMVDGGYFDKEHSLELGKRATELGISYLPSFHYSDYWMSNAKAYTPEEWLQTDYEGNKTNTDLAHMQSIVYNYVYDFIKTLADNNVNVAGVKHGNEQNGGIVFPVGQGSTSAGHALLIAASYDAAEAAMPGVCGYVHSNNGYTPSASSTFFNGLKTNGAKFDAAAFSLYGGHASSDILSQANYMLGQESMKYLDYVNVETGFTFTRYAGTVDTQSGAMGQSAYYNTSANGQYNWLLDYMQAALDIPNPYGQTRGFYYWETDWIPTPGAESSEGGPANVDARTMFNNGDASILEMGSTKAGKAGDMMDSMYAYLMRGCAKDKADTLQTPLRGYGTYTVDVTEPTGITLSASTMSLAEGAVQRLKPTVAPVDKVLSDSNITYMSSNPAVAKVTQDGFVCAVSAGTATITASVKGGHTASVAVTVTSAVKTQSQAMAVKVNDTAVTAGATKDVKVFDKLQLTTTLPSTATNKAVIYTSSNPEVASFLGETWQTPAGEMRQQTDKTTTKVQLNIKKNGTTTITATTADGGDSVSFVVNAAKVDATSVTLNKTETNLSYSRTLQLTGTVLPSTTTFYKVTWESDDETVATVDQNGLVTGVGTGDATIRVTSQDNPTLYAECLVHVIPVQTEGVTLDKANMAIQIGSTKTLNASVSPSDAYNKKVLWTSSNDNIASVNENGEVTGVAIGGPVTITATTENGGFIATCSVTVQQDAIPVTGVSLDKSSYYFASDYFSDTNPDSDAPSYRLTAAIEPAMATNDDIIWNSDTPEVATVDIFGRVTAVSHGVARITATTSDGGFVAYTDVYVPAISESFDNREAGDTWGMAVGSAGGGALSAAVTAGTDGNTLLITGGGTGGRSIQKSFSQAVSNDKIVIDLDWNVGAPAYSNGSYIAIRDSSNNRYLSIQTNSNTELVYSTGGVAVGNTALADTTAVGTGFNVNNTWYHLHVILDMKAKNVTFTIVAIDKPTLTATHTVAFPSGTSFAGNVKAIELYGNRSSGTLAWSPILDNVNIYEAAPVAKSVNLNTSAVKLIPIEGTLGASYQAKAQVLPESVGQNVVWTTSDSSVATVSSTGLITPANLYQTVDEIVPGTCTIKAASASDASVYKEITVTISNNPNAAEFFSVVDEVGNKVYDSGTGSVAVGLEAGTEKQYFAILTGGDGDTDIAGINWESSNPEIISVNAATGKLFAEDLGNATLTLTVTLYTGSPLSVQIPFEVTGIVPLKVSALKNAISAAKEAKEHDDDYYTVASLQAYLSALQTAESDLQTAEAEGWDSTWQSLIDDDVTNLNAAVAGLEKDDVVAIKSIQITGSDLPISVGKKAAYGASVTPEYATESVVWESSDETVAFVNKRTGEVLGLKAGTVIISAKGENGTVKSQKTVTVTSDLTSYYDTNGVTLSSTNTVANKPHTNPFVNARTMRLNGDGWSTGSNTTMGSIAVNLGTSARIDDVKTCFWGLMKYTIDISDDGIDWTTVVDHSDVFTGTLSDGSVLYTDIMPENTTTQYIRINTLAIEGTGWVGITIMQVNGAYLTDNVFLEDYSCQSVDLNAGTEFTESMLPTNVSVELNTGETTDVPVIWNATDIAKLATETVLKEAAGTYEVNGTIIVEGIEYDVICPVVVTTDVQNLLTNSGFEEGATAWTLDGCGSVSDESFRNGSQGVAFGSESAVSFTLTQKITVDKAGIYNAYAYISGGYGSARAAGSDIYLSAVTTEGKIYDSSKVILSGKSNDWSHPRVAVRVPEGGTEITLTMHVTASAGSWGVIDDAGLYLDKGFALTQSSLTMTQGQTEDLTFANDEAVEENLISWSSTNTDCATVVNGRVTAVGAGTAVITASILGGDVTATCRVTVSTKDIAGATITLGTNSYFYDGTEKKPAVTAVVLGGKTLELNKDYGVSYSNNKNAGSAIVNIAGIGNYAGTATKNFTISKADLKGAVIALSATSFGYDGKEKKPTVVSVTVGSNKVAAGEYTVSYANNKNAGTATVIISGTSTGNYTGTATKTFVISKATKGIKVAKTTIKKVYGDKAFAIGASVPTGEKMTYSLSNKKVVKVENNGKVIIIGCGTVTVTVKSVASANYSAARDAKVAITVAPKKAKILSATSKKSKQLTATWKKDVTVTGYEVCYSTDVKFKSAKSAKVKSSKTTSTTIKKLSKGKKYYVKVRSYTTVGGKTVYGAYSTVKSVTVK